MLETRRWWHEERGRFSLYCSQAVLGEAAEGDPSAAAERLAVLQGLPLLATTDLAIRLAENLLSQAALPKKARIDVLHLGIAAVNGLDFLLTWNCRHLASAALRSKIDEICRRAGYEPPIICTPYDLPGDVP